MTVATALEPRGVAAGLVAAVALSGCIGAFVPPPDDLSTWQSVPLQPDPALAEAARDDTTCRSGHHEGAPIQIVLQDRRTASTAAFLVAGPASVGSCFRSASGGSSGGGSQPAGQLAPLRDAIAVDEDAAGGLAGGTAHLLGGRAQAGVQSVRVLVADGRTVEASVGNGHWLAWWPGESAATQLIAMDSAGGVLATLEGRGPDGWTTR